MLPLVRHPWHAFVLMAIEGAGSAGFWPSQSTLLSRLTSNTRRHAAFAQQRLTMNLGIGLGGLAGGFIAHVRDPHTFTILFTLDALTFLGYVGVVFLVHDPGNERNETSTPASYGAVLRHKTFLGLWGLNFLFVMAGYSLINLLPQFARDHSHVSEREIGLIFAVNTGVIVLAQLPFAHWIEGKRRMRALALMPALWAVAWLIVDGTGRMARRDCGLRGVRTCRRHPRHRRVLPRPCAPGARRRHRPAPPARPLLRDPLSVVGARGTVGPAAGGFILAAEPYALWPLAAGVCIIASLGALAMERFIPPGLRRIPREAG